MPTHQNPPTHQWFCTLLLYDWLVVLSLLLSPQSAALTCIIYICYISFLIFSFWAWMNRMMGEMVVKGERERERERRERIKTVLGGGEECKLIETRDCGSCRCLPARAIQGILHGHCLLPHSSIGTIFHPLPPPLFFIYISIYI